MVRAGVTPAVAFPPMDDGAPADGAPDDETTDEQAPDGEVDAEAEASTDRDEPRPAGSSVLTNGGLAFVLATALLVGTGLFTWFSARYTGIRFLDPSLRAQFSAASTMRGWDSTFGWVIPVVIAVVMSFDLTTARLRRPFPFLAAPAAPLGAATLAALGVLITVIRGDDLGRHGQALLNGGTLGVDASREMAAYFAAVAAIGLVAAGERIRRERLTQVTDR